MNCDLGQVVLLNPAYANSEDYCECSLCLKSNHHDTKIIQSIAPWFVYNHISPWAEWMRGARYSGKLADIERRVNDILRREHVEAIDSRARKNRRSQQKTSSGIVVSIRQRKSDFMCDPRGDLNIFHLRFSCPSSITELCSSDHNHDKLKRSLSREVYDKADLKPEWLEMRSERPHEHKNQHETESATKPMVRTSTDQLSTRFPEQAHATEYRLEKQSEIIGEKTGKKINADSTRDQNRKAAVEKACGVKSFSPKQSDVITESTSNSVYSRPSMEEVEDEEFTSWRSRGGK